MAVSKLNSSGEPEEVHCNWCGASVTPETAQQYGANYHICDSCTLKFGQRASVVIESNPSLAEKVEEQIESGIDPQKPEGQS